MSRHVHCYAVEIKQMVKITATGGEKHPSGSVRRLLTVETEQVRPAEACRLNHSESAVRLRLLHCDDAAA
jgi:hypothetical protein